MTLSEIARLTGFPYETIYGHVLRGSLPTTRNEKGHHVVEEADVDRLYPQEERGPRIEKMEAERARRVAEREAGSTVDAPRPVVRESVLEIKLRGALELVEEVKKSREDWKKQANDLMTSLSRSTDHNISLVESIKKWQDKAKELQAEVDELKRELQELHVKEAVSGHTG